MKIIAIRIMKKVDMEMEMEMKMNMNMKTIMKLCSTSMNRI